MDWRLVALVSFAAACSPEARHANPFANPRVIKVNQHRLASIETGRGEPLVFVHGGFQDYRMWRRYIPGLAPRFRVIAYSRRNHFPNGASPGGVPDFAADLHADDLARLIADKNLGPVHLIAHSSGAHAALFFAARNPALVRSLIVVEPPAAGLLTDAPEDRQALEQFTQRSRLALDALRTNRIDLAMRLFADAVGGPGTIDRRTSAQKAMMLDNVNAHKADARSKRPRPRFTCDMAARIKAPTLVINGTRSPAFFHRIADRLSACLTDVSRLSIAASHTVPSENPVAFERAMIGFLARTAR